MSEGKPKPRKGKGEPKVTQQQAEAGPQTPDISLGPPTPHTALLQPQGQQGPQFKETKLPLLSSIKEAGIGCMGEVKP